MVTYTEWETDLQMEIDRVESDRPGYDEYRYNLGAIEHDPYVLMGYLTSAYQGFTYDEVESVLRQLFQEQYTLSFSEETEIRYRTETSVDPETGEETQEEVPYEWRILNVKLTVTPLENLVVSRMNADQKEICEILLQTKGNRQYVKNVFGTNWLPYVTSYYGYRVHPISGEKNYHTGVDIGMPEGTEILAGHDGTVTLTLMFGAQFGFPYPPTAVQNRAFQHDDNKLFKRQPVIAEKSRGGNGCRGKDTQPAGGFLPQQRFCPQINQHRQPNGDAGTK